MEEYSRMLQQWYCDHCDGEWEHSYGIDIATLDNPGWQVKISGIDDGSSLLIEREGENDWLRINADAFLFEGYGGAANLTEILAYAVRWLSLK